MPWKVTVPYDRQSPYTFDDSRDAAAFIVSCDAYQENYEYDEGSYQDYINEDYACVNNNRKVIIGSYEFWPDEVLKEMDEDSYWEGYDAQRRYFASESYDYVEEQLDRYEYDGGEIDFEGSIHCEYYEESEEEDEDDEGHDVDEFDELLAM